jgi:hypothetical protein
MSEKTAISPPHVAPKPAASPLAEQAPPLVLPDTVMPASKPASPDDKDVIKEVTRDVVRIHYCYEADDGQIFSGPAGIKDPAGMLPKLNPGGPITKKRLRFACHPTAVHSHFHRSTNMLARGAGDAFVVNCPDCLKSERFLKDLAEYEKQFDPVQMFDTQGKPCC